ncbi:MAG: MFS transporter, partial [Acidobacteriota bacterium]|nr:MFS transporter [Acidobacteriota bacterium]
MSDSRSQTRLRPSPRIVLAVAAIGGALAFVDATIVNIALPNMRQSFTHSSFATLSWVLNAYNIVLAAFLVAAGRIVDLLGRRRMFIIGIETFVVASVLCALAPTVWALILFRVVQALGAALLVPASQALVLNAFPPARRAHGIALLAAVAAGAAGLGPSLGGLLVAALNWRLVFLVNVPLGALAIALGRRQLVENRAPGRRRLPDLLGALLFAVAVGALVTAVVDGGTWGWASLKVIGLFVVFAALTCVVAWRCTWHRAPVLDLSLLRDRSFTVANGMTLIAAGGFYGYTLANVLFLTQVWGYSVLKAGLAITIGPFVAMAVAGPTSVLVQRLGHRLVLFAGGVIWGVAILWFVVRVGIRPDFLGEWLPGVVLLGLGAGTLFPNLSGAAVASAPGDSFATATALNSVARQCGAAFGVAIVVAVLGNPDARTVMHAFHGAWTFGAGCMFAAGAGCLLIGSLRVAASPSITAATREMLRPLEPAGQPSEAAPRARRAIVL